MGNLKIENFQQGLDTRRSVLETKLGALIELENAHINQGGEIEKRKKFLRQALPTGTFGLQSIGSSLLTFGSDDPASTITAALAAITDFSIAYQRLQHPAVTDGLVTYSAGSHAMESVLHSTVFGTKAFVVVEFADGQVFAYYDGSIVRDFLSGNIVSYLAGNNILLAKNIVALINEQGEYTATQLTFATTNRLHAGTVATLTFASTTGLVTGQSVKITSVGDARYNVDLVTLTNVTSTQVTYTTVGNFADGPTVDVGGLLTSCLIKVAGTNGVDFSVITQATTVGDGSFGVSTTTQENTVGVPGNSAIATFKITGGRVGGAATATLTDATNALPTATQIVTIGTKAYTFVAAITNVEGQVLIGVSANATLQNLIDAINHGNNAGVNYYCATANTDVAAGALNTGTHAFTVEALIGGTAGNNIAKSGTPGVLAWDAGGGGTKLSGGTASAGVNLVSQVEVVSPAGARVSLLANPVEFVTDTPTTCAAVVTEINAYTDTSHYTAVLTNYNEISIYSLTTASPQPTNYNLVVTAKGNVCVGDCYFYFTPTNFATFAVSTLTINGADVLGGAITLSTLSPSSLTALYTLIETQVNAGSAAHGINACAHAGHLQLSKRVTSNTDQTIAVFANLVAGITTFTDANPVIPPSVDNTLEIVLSVSGETIYYGSTPAHPSATAVGGIPPYTFRWGSAYEQTLLGPNQTWPPFATAVLAYVNAQHYEQYHVLTFVLSEGAENLATTSFGQWWANFNLYSYNTVTYPLVWQCEVTDAIGQKAAKTYTLNVIF